MAKETNAPKGVPGNAKKLPVKTTEGPAAAAGAPKKIIKQAQPQGLGGAAGKVIRKDTPAKETPANDATQPLMNETAALDMAPEDEAEPTPAAADDADKGASVLGDFKLLKKLGQGGMGAVYKAHQQSLDRVVAVKVLAKQLVSKKEFVLRFQREAKLMAKLDHPNILRCYAVSKDEAKGLHYIALEFVEGGSVEGWLKKLGRFTLGDALHIVLKTAEALQHAHEKSLIHRDIKPDNLLLTKAGVLKVADLGLAKDTDDDVSLTKSGAGAGTPIYMAPEQAYNVKHVDCRVDIYALGVMLYVFLTGHPPFGGNTSIELIMAKEKAKFDPIRKFNDDVPAKVDLIVDKMLAKDPKHRYASCADVINELEPLGLANDSLSFLAPTGEASATKRPAKPAATKAPAPAAKAPAKTDVSARKPASAKTNVEDEEAVERDVWYWNIVTQQGKIITKKVTTEQIRMLIKAGHMDEQAQIGKTMKGTFRSAATFSEFQPLFKSKETATKANVKGQKYGNKFKELAEADARRRRWGWLSRSFKSFGGMLFGLLWITLILAIVGGGGYFVYITFMK